MLETWCRAVNLASGRERETTKISYENTLLDPCRLWLWKSEETNGEDDKKYGCENTILDS